MAPSSPPPEAEGKRVSHRSRTSSVHVFDNAHAFADVDSDYGLRAKAGKWLGKQRKEFRAKRDTYTPLDWLACALPCISWIKTYSLKQNLLMDLTAGISIGFMVVPQGMSYALLAGLPAVYGLYGTFVPVFLYAVFGSSRHLAVGPVAVTSLLLGQALRDIYPAAKLIDDPNNPPPELAQTQLDYNAAAIQVSFLVGVLYTAVGVLRLGFFANFLSHSVISGFTTGAALIIGLSQLKYLFGVVIKSKHTALETAIELGRALDETQWREVVMCVVWLALLLTIKNVSKRYKKLSWLRPLGPISVCIIAILVVVIGDLDGKGLVRVVGTVPKGLPSPTIDKWFPLVDSGRQVSTAFVLFLVGFMESISISKALARKHKYTIGVTQEIMAMGIANFFGAMFNAYPATGSFSRSAVAADIGAKTPLQGIITGVVVLLVLSFITPVFERVPYNAMGAIVLSSVLGLFELSEALFLFKANFLDFLVWLAAFLGTIFLGVEIGLGIAIGLAIVLVVYQSAFPHTAVLGRLPETQVYRNIKQYPSAQQTPHIVVVRVDAPIYFANVEWIRSRVAKYRDRNGADKRLGPVHYIVLDMAPVPFVDSTGMHALHELVQSLREAGQRLVLANPSRAVQAQLKRVHILEEIGQQWVYVRTADAVAMCAQHLNERLAQQGAETAGDVAVADISLSLPASPRSKGGSGKARASEDAGTAIASGAAPGSGDGASGSRRVDEWLKDEGERDAAAAAGESRVDNALVPRSQQSDGFFTPKADS